MSLTSIMILIFLGVFFLYFGIIRNTQVYNYRIKLIDKISKRYQDDLDLEDTNSNQPVPMIMIMYDCIKRYQQFRKINHHIMVLYFWKPLDSFYKDEDSLKDFLK